MHWLNFSNFSPVGAYISNALFFSLSFCHQQRNYAMGMSWGSAARGTSTYLTGEPGHIKGGGREEQSLMLSDKGEDRVPRVPKESNRVKLTQTLKFPLGKTTHCYLWMKVPGFLWNPQEVLSSRGNYSSLWSLRDDDSSLSHFILWNLSVI